MQLKRDKIGYFLSHIQAPCFSHPLFLGHYIDDIVESLYEKEQTRKKFNFSSPQIDYRGVLVDFMQNFAENRGFRRASLHLGESVPEIVCLKKNNK